MTTINDAAAALLCAPSATCDSCGDSHNVEEINDNGISCFLCGSCLDKKLTQARNPFRNLKVTRTDAPGWYRADHEGRAFYIHKDKIGKKAVWAVTACDDYPEISRDQRQGVQAWIVRWMAGTGEVAYPGGAAYFTLRAAKQAIISASLLQLATLKKEAEERKLRVGKRKIAKEAVRRIIRNANTIKEHPSLCLRAEEILADLSEGDLATFCAVIQLGCLDIPSREEA